MFTFILNSLAYWVFVTLSVAKTTWREGILVGGGGYIMQYKYMYNGHVHVHAGLHLGGQGGSWLPPLENCYHSYT